MGGILAECKICLEKIKGSIGVSSNFIRHLRIKHSIEYDQYDKEKKADYMDNSKKNFDKRILMFLASTYSPLSVVENPEFQNLFKGFPVKLKSRRVIGNLLDENHDDWILKTTEKLKEVQYCCTTADIWSTRHRSFFGYTCHYIEPISFKRKHIALACRRFTGSHNYEKIAEMINNIHKEFELDNRKIILSITDNGSNFCKAFKEYGISETIICEQNESEDDDEDEEIVSEIQSDNLTLPNHFRCASHTLNLLSSTDFLQIIKKDEKIYFRHKHAFMRCSDIWKKCNRPKSAEIIQQTLSSSLKTPTVTRWNSLYDSVKCLLKHKEKISTLCNNLVVAKLSSLDIEYLEQYEMIMEPIANAIDFLQGENQMYFGYFLAAIISLKVKLVRISENDGIGNFKEVCEELIKALVGRFEVFFKGGEEAYLALFAAMSHPAIKLRFLPILQQTAPDLTLAVLKQKFAECASICTRVNEEVITPKISADIGFLDFGEIDRPTIQIQKDEIQNEVDTYLLDSDTNLHCLKKYNIIRQMFLKFNVPLPSSAPVERLFSFSGMVDAPRRNKLSDSNFEKLVMLKANNNC